MSSLTQAISSKGIRLYAASNGNGGALEISIKDKSGHNCYINSIKLVICALTGVNLSATSNGNDLGFTRFEGPECAEGGTDGSGNPAHDYGRFYQDINAKKVTLKNGYTNGTYSAFSYATIVSMEIEYTMMPNN